jgi:hypothetical protein
VRADSWRPRRWQSEQLRQPTVASGSGTMNREDRVGFSGPTVGHGNRNGERPERGDGVSEPGDERTNQET